MTNLSEAKFNSTQQIVMDCDLAKRMIDPIQLLESIKASITENVKEVKGERAKDI